MSTLEMFVEECLSEGEAFLWFDLERGLDSTVGEEE
jgi:hypothetical protein